MNFAKLIKSRQLRIRLLRYLDFIPDVMMLKIQYRLKTGQNLNLDNPQRYTEKLQWYKLFYKDSLMSQCSNKLTVRDYVAKQGYRGILNELYGVYNNPEEINFTDLPNQFVIKATIGAGGNSVIVCKDKNKFDISSAIQEMKNWIRYTPRKSPGREWIYDNQNNQIIIEKYLYEPPETGGLIDYKFFCFQGKVHYLYVIADREIGNKAGLGIYTKDFKKMNVQRDDEKVLSRKVNKPKNYENMVRCAEELSSCFPHARIDLYNLQDQIVFGEITFFDGSGYMSFTPDSFDYKLGNAFILPKKRKIN